MTRWLSGIVVPIAATLIAHAIAMTVRSFGAEQVLFVFVPAVMVASWHGGLTGGLVASATSMTLVALFLLEPGWPAWLVQPGDTSMLVMFAGVCVSVTVLTAGRRRAERDRERALRDAEAARHDAEISSRLKDQFLATLSHELRTPLNAVLGWAHMLAANDVDGAKVPAALASIERNAHAQKQLVDDLLDVSAIVSGRDRHRHRSGHGRLRRPTRRRSRDVIVFIVRGARLVVLVGPSSFSR